LQEEGGRPQLLHNSSQLISAHTEST